MDENYNYQQLTGRNLTDAVRRALEYERRIAFVDSVCGTVTDCRFGSASDINPQIELPLFDDPDEDIAPFYESSLKTGGKVGELATANTVLAGENIIGTETPSSLDSNRGRGSPKTVFGT